MSAPIVIEDYDCSWPGEFETIRARISDALGDLAAAIEHVGSTAVLGLAAKPIIDIDVLLKSHSNLPAAISKLSEIGYPYQGDLGIPGREAFRAPAGGFEHHLYVCPPGGEEFARHIAFRDHLRANPNEAAAYACLKRRLAEQFALNRDAYTEEKTEFIR